MSQFAGVDFPSNFEQDNYTVRHTQGNNMFDPESLITGAELEAGFTYANSRRVYNDCGEYLAAVHGDVKINLIDYLFPRVRV